VRPRASSVVLWGALLFLYAPVAVLVLYSFNDSRFSSLWQGFTLDWYARLLQSPETRSATLNTVIVSLTSTVVSTILGTLLAIGLHLRRFRGRAWIEQLVFLPVVAPDIIMGVALLAFFVALGFPLGRATIVLAHVSFQISFVTLVVRSRLAEFPPAVMEAARDLGAAEPVAIRKVMLPLARPGILAGALLALALSIDDFVITYFTAGAGSSTLPIRIYSMVKRGVTPDINALSTLLLALTLVVLAGALRAQRPALGSAR
jgi:spermidine/putrescine transport system permease protein